MSEGADAAIGQRIREARGRIGWRQEDLARRLGRHFTTISNWERGVTHPPIAVLREVARVTGVDDVWLITGEEGQRPQGVLTDADISRIRDAVRADDIARAPLAEAFELAQGLSADAQSRVIAFIEFEAERERAAGR